MHGIAKAHAKSPADAVVVVTTSGGVEWRGAFVDFVIDHRRSLSMAKIQTICAVIAVGATYLGETYTIRPAPFSPSSHP